jgi:hypothetical protein
LYKGRGLLQAVSVAEVSVRTNRCYLLLQTGDTGASKRVF